MDLLYKGDIFGVSIISAPFDSTFTEVFQKLIFLVVTQNFKFVVLKIGLLLKGI